MSGVGLPPDALAEHPAAGVEAERPQRPAGHRGWSARKALALCAALAGVGVIAAGGAGFWAYGHLDGSPGAPLTVTLPEGASRTQAANILASDGVVSDSWLFRVYLHYERAGPFHGGRYDLRRHEGYRAALRDLRQGPELTRLTIPEGFTLTQIAARVGSLPGYSAQKFLDAARSGVVRSPLEPAGTNNLEGLLFPDTYLLRSGEDEQAILQQMVDEGSAVARELGLDAPGTLPNGLSGYQTVVLASMVEREAKVPGDRGMIARVIVNRLKRGMKLQIDATVLYALGAQTTALTRTDLELDSPYNTYRVVGLPPGPIAAPGRASLLAALEPTPGPWLYYVLADASGKHAFATNERDFLRLRAQAAAKGLLG